MTNHIEPTEEYDGRIRVKLVDDHADTRVIPCSSYTEAITLVKEHQHEVTTAKIIDREQEVVFSSADMDIDVWESIWKNEKRRLSVNVEDRDCPYDNVSCFFDDLCVQCKMDKLRRDKEKASPFTPGMNPTTFEQSTFDSRTGDPTEFRSFTNK
nr:hypothetical protein [Halorubrum kocurii]